jgi:transposase-like protein
LAGWVGLSRVKHQSLQVNPQSKELYIPEKEGISLTCPFCRSDHLESLGLQSLGKFEVKGGIPILNANHEDQLLMAYYRCKNCNRVFYFVPEKVEGK